MSCCATWRGDAEPPGEAEAPVVALTDQPLPGEQPAGVLPRTVTAAQLDAALRAVAAGLLVRAPGGIRRRLRAPPATTRRRC